MEDLEFKLNSSSPIVVAQIFSKIVENIKQKYKEDIPELKFLKEKCISPEPAISEIAVDYVTKLVEDEVLPLEATMAEFITMISLTKSYSSLTRMIGNLLNLELKQRTDKDKSLYNLYLPQHPYIKLLIENRDSWNCVFNEIRILYINQNREHVTNLFRPIYLYTLCNPVQNNLELLNHKLFKFLLIYSSDEESNVFSDILCWIQVETKNNIETNAELLNEALNYFFNSSETIANLEIVLLWQASIIYNMALYKFDIRFYLNNITNILVKRNNLVSINGLLLILTKIIEICSPVYVLDLLILCKHLLAFEGKNIFVLESLKSSLLQWLLCPSILSTEANNIANSIFAYIDNYKEITVQNVLEEFYNQHKHVLSANSLVFEAMHISLLLPQFSTANGIVEWLNRIENCSSRLIEKLYHFLCGLFISKRSDRGTQTKSFSLILNHVEENKEQSSHLLTLILYRLSNAKDPQLHFMLLKALPKMIVLRNNIPKVMATLQALSQGSVDMYNFGLSLIYDAWKHEPKCYSYLENMLVLYGSSEKKWETYVTKAFILKELCEKKPELYGKDMVAHLSRVLNDCNDVDGSLPCALAIEGIRSLCRAEVIDVVTTWATLWPKFKRDTRLPVIKSLCSLIHEIPQLPYTESYTDLRKEVILALWDYTESDDAQIKEVALDSLTSFTFEEICAQLPEKYLDEAALEDRQKVGMGIPQLVPGHVWVKFISENGASQGVINFIIKLISIEVSNYLKYVYQVKGTREPTSYAYLPTHSIVRGISDFVRTWISKWKNSVHEVLYIECLKILSREYSKPLPPLDWCFLQELLHEPRLKNICVDIACHQVILSGTARRLIENYIAAVVDNPQEADILNIMKNLNHLANSIQPIILKPFFEKAIKFTVNNYTSGCGEKSLETIAKYLIQVLQNKDIQETNKTTIAQVLTDQISVTNIKSELFEIFLNCIIALPTKCLQEITNLKTEVSAEWFEKITKIRCTAAVVTTTAPLTWLNDVIDVSSTMKRSLDTQEELITVFRKHRNNGAECALWLLDLIGHIQAKVADRCDEKQILYFCDVFVLAVVELSGFAIFALEQTTDYDILAKKLFPQAFNALMNMNHWSVCTTQALEWLYHMNTEETVPIEYRNLFGLALQALRHDEEFSKNLRWMKYLSSNVG